MRRRPFPLIGVGGVFCFRLPVLDFLLHFFLFFLHSSRFYAILSSEENARPLRVDKEDVDMTFEERKAQVRSYLGKTVRIEMDRPIGTEHPKHPGLFYPINYGYIPGVYGGDGEELDVYLLGVDQPIMEYTARIIGIVHRHNDVEDKLVAAPLGMEYTKEEMEAAIRFQESYYDSEVEPLA